MRYQNYEYEYCVTDNMEAATMVRSPDGNTDFFVIVTGFFSRITLAPYLFILYLNYVLRTSIDLINENSLIQECRKQTIYRRNYSTQTTRMTYHFSQIYKPKQNLYCISYCKQQKALTSTWMHIKQCTWVFKPKWATSTLKDNS